MRPNWRITLVATTAAVFATSMAPPGAFGLSTDWDSKPAIVGSTPTARGASDATSRTVPAVTVTLVTGDRVLVGGAGTDNPSATVLPRADGTVPIVETRRVGRDVYVYPADAATVIADGRVDEQLFNVTGLVTQGYDDASTKTLPVIAQYGSKVDLARAATATPRGATKSRSLASIRATALKTDKTKAREFWADATNPSSTAGKAIGKLWLDRRISASLDRSTAQVNAPQAWATGLTGTGTTVAVLDTGADAEHPDLAGRIVGSQDFTGSAGGALSDIHGHGTHTASTVGGSGAASAGAKKGVAPTTDLIVGKVLDDHGSGSESGIIAGMEWAVGRGADVISMSLGSGGPVGDCTDPLAAAAQTLSTTSTSLFVIAAGNTGPGNNTVSSPACAPAALSVGAVDRTDETATFSSKGPAAYSHTLKPEIAAPGVEISAAKAGGRGADAYVGMSGTSMATPHVAGAAAIVKQAHPAWTGAQLKAALVSSAQARIPGDVRETGAGRLDVLAAVNESVTTPAVQAGTFTWPHSAKHSTSVQVPYTNGSNVPVTLRLALAAVTGDDGSTLKASPFTLGASRVTIPAGGTVSVPLKVNPAVKLAAAQLGDVTGRIIATGGATVSTPFAAYIAPKSVKLTITMTDRLGHAAAGASSVDVINTDSTKGERRFNEGEQTQVFDVRPGTYLVSGFVQTPDAEGAQPTLSSIAYFARPELTIKGDTTIRLDATKAHRLDVRTDRPSEARSSALSFTRTWDDIWVHSGSMSGGSNVTAVYADIQGKPKDGTWEFGTYSRRYAPAVESMSVVRGPTLHPTTPNLTVSGLDGADQAPLVDAGAGTASDLTAEKVQGKVALVRLSSPTGNPTSDLADLAQKAGARALLISRPAPGPWAPSTGFQAVPIAAYSLPMAEGDALKALLAGAPNGERTLAWKGNARSPYVYNLGFEQSTPLTHDKTFVVKDAKLGRTEATYGSMGVATAFLDYAEATRPSGVTIGVSDFEAVPAPGKRTEFFTDGGSTWSQFVISSFPFGEQLIGTPRRYSQGSARNESWYDGVIAPTAIRDANGVEQLTAERQGGLMGFAPQLWGDSFGHVAVPGSFGDFGSLALKRNGELIGQSAWPSGVFEVPAEDSLYEVTLDQSKRGPATSVWKRSSDVTTTWAFRSAVEKDVQSRGLPLLFPRVDLPEDGLKTVAAQTNQSLRLGVTGHGGYTPGAITAAKVAFSYDGGTTWTDAAVSRADGTWTATVDHTGAAGRTVALRVELTDAKGAKVTQTVQAAYAVR